MPPSISAAATRTAAWSTSAARAWQRQNRTATSSATSTGRRRPSCSASPTRRSTSTRTGKVIELINITGHDGQGAPLVLGNTVGAGRHRPRQHHLRRPGEVFFETDENSEFGAEVGHIWGNAAIFDFQQTWDDVTIVNESRPRHRGAAHRRGQAGRLGRGPGQRHRRAERCVHVPVRRRRPGETFHFEIVRSFIETAGDDPQRPGLGDRLGHHPLRPHRQPDRQDRHPGRPRRHRGRDGRQPAHPDQRAGPRRSQRLDRQPRLGRRRACRSASS